MGYTIIFASVVKAELQVSYDWYEEQKLGLGEHFLNIIEVSLSSIANQPLFYPVKFANYRQYVVPKFPYVIIFEIVEEFNTIYILHVFNTNRDDKKKFK